MVEYNGATVRDYSLDRMPQTLPALQKAIARVDQTAGRAIYIWDSLNAREQIVYGDTGWRNITSLLGAGATGSAHIRRINSTVELIFSVAFPAATASGVVLLAVPVGFESSLYKTYAPVRLSTAPTVVGVAARPLTGSIYLALPSPWDTAWGNMDISLTYTTTTSWPTVLPGTAVGTIPNI